MAAFGLEDVIAVRRAQHLRDAEPGAGAADGDHAARREAARRDRRDARNVRRPTCATAWPIAPKSLIRMNWSTPSRSSISAGRMIQGLLVSLISSPADRPGDRDRRGARAGRARAPRRTPARRSAGSHARRSSASPARPAIRRARSSTSAIAKRAWVPPISTATTSISVDPIAASIADAPFSASSAPCAEEARTARGPCPPRRRRRHGRLARGPFVRIDQRVELAASAHRAGRRRRRAACASGPPPSASGLTVDRRRHLARRARHAAVGDQRDPEARDPAARRAAASACAVRACRWRAAPGSGRRRRRRGRARPP